MEFLNNRMKCKFHQTRDMRRFCFALHKIRLTVLFVAFCLENLLHPTLIDVRVSAAPPAIPTYRFAFDADVICAIIRFLHIFTSISNAP